MRTQRLIGLLFWLLALGMAAWVLRQLPLHSVLDTFARLGWRQWLAWTCINSAVILVLNLRWLVLIRMLGMHLGFLRLLLVRQAGQLISFLTPGPQFGGEPFQVYWLYRRFNLAIHSSILSLGLDRFYELWVNFSVLILGIALLAISGDTIGFTDWPRLLAILGLLVLLLSLLGWLVMRRPQWLTGYLKNSMGRWLESPRLQRLGMQWQALGTDLARMESHGKPALWCSLLLSLLGWAAITAEMLLVLNMLGVEVTFRDVVFILVATRLALLLPLPAGLGPLEASVLWSFQILALPVAAALGLIALMRLRDAVVLVIGLGCLRLLQPVAD